jgi:hypothetical protein
LIKTRQHVRFFGWSWALTLSATGFSTELSRKQQNGSSAI